jgi:hypothetical protein
MIEEWQTSFREAGVLTHALERLEPSLATPTLAKQYLRVIGNCVADNGAVHHSGCVVRD